MSNIGNIRRIDKGSVHYLKPFMRDGYLLISLRKEGIKKNYPIHRLVAKAFIANPDNLPQINHKNYIRTDNRTDNLEWCTAKYNVRYSIAKPIVGYNKKMAVVFEAITDVQIIGLSVSSVSNCLNGRTKTAHNMKWRYITKEQLNSLKNNPKAKHYGNIRQIIN